MINMNDQDSPETVSEDDDSVDIVGKSSGNSSRRRGRLWLFAAVGALLVVGVVIPFRSTPLPEGISPDEYAAAAEKFRSLYKKEPDRLDVLSLAAELAVAESRPEDAVACFAEIPSSHPRYGLAARRQEGHVLLELNRAREAEASLRAYLALAAHSRDVRPMDVYAARSRLAFLLSVELRLEERQSLLASAHESGTVDVFNSKQYFFPHLLIWNSKTGSDRLDKFLEVDPDNRHLRLAHARYLIAQGELEQALAGLKKLVAEDASDLAVAAAVLACHFEADDWDAFAESLKSIPKYRIGEPWLLTRMRGHFALEQKKWDLAVTRFKQVLAADRTNPSAQSAIVKAFRGLNQTENADVAMARSAVIAKIRAGLVREEALDELAANCEEIGMPDAAETFRRHADTLKREGVKSLQFGLPDGKSGR